MTGILKVWNTSVIVTQLDRDVKQSVTHEVREATQIQKPPVGELQMKLEKPGECDTWSERWESEC